MFSNLAARRLLEFKANASPLSPEELVRLDHPEGDYPEHFADETWSLREDFGLRVLGHYKGLSGFERSRPGGRTVTRTGRAAHNPCGRSGVGAYGVTAVRKSRFEGLAKCQRSLYAERES